MSMQTLDVFQGRQYGQVLQIRNLDGTAASNTFTSGSVLSASVYEGQNQATLFAPTVTWYTATVPTQTGYDQGQFSVSITGTSTANLNPAGEYFLLVDQTTAGLTSAVWEGRVKILATPGSTTFSPPDLATYDYVEAILTDLSLTDGQRDNIPYLVSAASQVIRRYCNDRFFTLSSFTESYPVALDGFVRLYQVPVNQVTRVQGQPQLALTVANTSSSVQYAYMAGTYTGQYNGYALNAQTLTGVVLTWAVNGVVSTSTITFTSNETIATLAGLINAVGSGWTATADSVLGLWPVTELDGLNVSQGCGQSSTPGGGATYNVLTDIVNAQFPANFQATGMIWTGTGYSNSYAARWGPGGDSMFGYYNQPSLGKVKVTYSAGFTTIPPDIQFQTAMIVKWKLQLGIQDLLLKSEKAADYSYTLLDTMIHSIPDSIREALTPWRLHYA